MSKTTHQQCSQSSSELSEFRFPSSDGPEIPRCSCALDTGNESQSIAIRITYCCRDRIEIFCGMDLRKDEAAN
jgi:hypothetical protein